MQSLTFWQPEQFMNILALRLGISQAHVFDLGLIINAGLQKSVLYLQTLSANLIESQRTPGQTARY